MSILFCCSSFLVLSFVVLNTNNTAAIVSAMDMTAKIRKKVSTENVAIYFSPASDLLKVVMDSTCSLHCLSLTET